MERISEEKYLACLRVVRLYLRQTEIELNSNIDMQTLLKNCNLRPRTITSLKLSGIYSVEDLMKWERKDIAKIRNFGKQSLLDLDAFLLSQNLVLK